MAMDHAGRSQGFAKTFLQGTVNGTRRKGIQKKRWEDNNPGVDWFTSGRHHQKLRQPGLLEGLGCKKMYRAPTVLKKTIGVMMMIPNL